MRREQSNFISSVLMPTSTSLLMIEVKSTLNFRGRQEKKNIFLMGTARSFVQVTHMALSFVLPIVELLISIHSTLDNLPVSILYQAFLYTQINSFTHYIFTEHLFCSKDSNNSWGKFEHNRHDPCHRVYGIVVASDKYIHN